MRINLLAFGGILLMAILAMHFLVGHPAQDKTANNASRLVDSIGVNFNASVVRTMQLAPTVETPVLSGESMSRAPAEAPADVLNVPAIKSK
ncbi:MAG: hypothetical protein AB7F86_13995 [Bdellovibrionales bacterium]